MEMIKADTIEHALEEAGRTYLCGNLKRDNGLTHIQNDGYEIGLTDYPEYTFENAHVHTFNSEYNYILFGSIKVFLLNEKKEYEFHAGDLFMFHPNEPYAAKQFPGTRTIFSKVPGGNDKKPVEMDEELIRWGSSWDVKYGGMENVENRE